MILLNGRTNLEIIPHKKKKQASLALRANNQINHLSRPKSKHQMINSSYIIPRTDLGWTVTHSVGKTRQESGTICITVTLDTRGKAHHIFCTAVTLNTSDVGLTWTLPGCIVTLSTVRAKGVTITRWVGKKIGQISKTHWGSSFVNINGARFTSHGLFYNGPSRQLRERKGMVLFSPWALYLEQKKITTVWEYLLHFCILFS